MMENGFHSTQFTPLGQHFTSVAPGSPKDKVAICRQVRIPGAHHFSPAEVVGFVSLPPEVCAALKRRPGTE